MKKLLMLSLFLVCAVSFGQDLKSMTKSTTASKVLNNDMIDKLASDQVGKITKKFGLSDKQQTQANDLVMKQLRSDKFQKMLYKYTPDQLMGAKGSEQVSQALMSDPKFTEELSGMLDESQKATLKKSMSSKG
ncbi:MAG: hypothetical protein AAGH46_05310 [Bacteroidota bacterium]